MDAFDLSDRIVDQNAEFIRSFHTTRDTDIRAFVDRRLVNIIHTIEGTKFLRHDAATVKYWPKTR